MTVTFSTSNLVVNGDAESGPASGSFGLNVPPQGWVTTGGTSAVLYSIGTPADLNTTDALVSQGGLAYLAGGAGASLSTATQIIDVSAHAARIDAGRVTMNLAAQLGGYASQDDAAEVVVYSLAADGVTVLDSLTLSGPLAADRGLESLLQDFLASETLLAGTRSLKVEVTFVRTSGTYNDGYADNISIQLDGVIRDQILVTTTQDFTLETIGAAHGISFLPGGSTASFASSQFGPVLISNGALIEGSYDEDRLEIHLGAGAVFSAKGFDFASWTDGADELVFLGTTGAEVLTGSVRDDIVEMGSGDDTVMGLDGDDWIDGGAGRDRLRGGLGADSFVLASQRSSRDNIMDFTSGEDHLVIEAARFGAGLVAGPLLASQFVANAGGIFTDGLQRFAYDLSTGRLYFDADGTGAAASVQIAQLGGRPVIGVGDFDII